MINFAFISLAQTISGIESEFSWITVYYMLLNSIIQEVAAMIIKLPNTSHKVPISIPCIIFLHLSFASAIDIVSLFFFFPLGTCLKS